MSFLKSIKNKIFNFFSRNKIKTQDITDCLLVGTTSFTFVIATSVLFFTAGNPTIFWLFFVPAFITWIFHSLNFSNNQTKRIIEVYNL